MKRILPAIVILLSLALLVPGVTLPILSISGSIEKSELAQAGITHLADGSGSARDMLTMMSSMLGLDTIQGEVEVFQKTRSIWGTVEELYQSGNILVALLVGVFSVVIPALKLILMLIQQTPIAPKAKFRLGQFTGIIAKWSMADVFVVALMVSYMAGNASAGMGELLKTTASFDVGFYYFSAYCVFSILSGYLMRRTSEAVNTTDESGMGARA
ncbi:paraquat-inducible protein A [Shewanella psychropiezotolerans]|uniref:Paraquat-inducible protein A n=1 Tax=Shewanella psychropiezotolerans TaxID=2593655 RepID=A0ABX5WSB6_9GAMM|nr:MULTISPECIES: paraquat-inducible protein A [Shewanella]MPY25342.1 paraquat-inducible protein A [Shewanella sp. YLB-07]QDO82013.1 paraquat-inducible protein A [Shewanella psychropiezotolerans]